MRSAQALRNALRRTSEPPQGLPIPLHGEFPHILETSVFRREIDHNEPDRASQARPPVSSKSADGCVSIFEWRNPGREKGVGANSGRMERQ